MVNNGELAGVIEDHGPWVQAASLDAWVTEHRDPPPRNRPNLLRSGWGADFEQAFDETRVLAANLIGMTEREAWTKVHEAGRQWNDISGASWVTADLNHLRVRVVIRNDRVDRATGG
jgi:hypothetical protein